MVPLPAVLKVQEYGRWGVRTQDKESWKHTLRHMFGFKIVGAVALESAF